MGREGWSWVCIFLFLHCTSTEQFFPTQLVITETAFQNGAVLGGIPFGPTVVELKDAAFRTVPVNDGRFITVTLLSDNESILTEDVALRFGETAVDGNATFASLEIRKLCTKCRLHFECQGLQVDSDPFDVVQSPPAEVRVVAIAPSGVFNFDLTPTTAIQMVDAGGNLITTQFSANISKQSGFGLLRNRRNILTNTSVPSNNNTLFFTEIFFDSPDVYAVRFDARTSGGETISTAVPSVLISGPAAQATLQEAFMVENQTALGTFAIQPIISARDIFGSLVIAATGSVVVTANLIGGNPSASLFGATEVRTEQGIAAFTDLAIDKVGQQYSISFSNPLFTTLTTEDFDVVHGSFSSLEVSVQPLTVIAGQVFDPAPVIHVLDGGRNLYPFATAVAVSIAGSTQAEDLLGNPTSFIVNAEGGVARFPGLSLGKIGREYQLLFQSGQQYSVLSQPFQVLASSPSSIVVSTQPGSALRGIHLSVAPVVSLLDVFGNTIPDSSSISRVSVELIGESQQATLAGTTTRQFANGTAEFDDLSVNNPATNYVLRFTANSSFVDESAPFTITGLVSNLEIITHPGGAIGGSTMLQQPVVALIDSNRQVVATASNLIEATLLSESNAATLTPTTARASATFGVVSFTDLAVDLAGSGYRLHFRTLLGASISLESNPFDVTAGPPSRLTIQVQPTDAVAALPLPSPPSVAVADAGGNIVALTTPLQVDLLQRGETIQAFEVHMTDGVAVLNSTIPAAGNNNRLLFTLPLADSDLRVQSVRFSVVPGAPVQITVDVQPPDAIVGQALSRDPVVSVRDAGGNLVPSYSNPMTVDRGEGPSGSYPIGNLSVAPADGVAVFAGLEISDTAKIYQLLFRTQRLGVTLSALSDVFAITREPVRLSLAQSAEREIAGESFSISTVVEVLDAEGTRVSALTLAINASVSPPAHLWGSTALFTANGIAEFADLAVDLVGFHDLVFTFQGLSAFYTVEIEVGEPSNLTIFTQPAHCMNATRLFIPPSVQFLDKGGNVVPGVTDRVDVSLLQNSRASSLSGVTSTAATDGVAVFDDLVLYGLGNGFTLLFSSGSLQVESNRFSVQGEVAKLGLVYFPTGVILSQNIDPFIKVAVLDTALNVIDGGGWRPPYVEVQVSLPTLSYPGISTPNIAVEGTTTAVVQRGVAVFTDLIITADTSLYQGVMLEFTTNVSTPSLSSPFFAPSFAEGALTVKSEPSALQTTGLTLVPFPVLEVLDGLNANVRGSAEICLVALTGSSVPATLAGTTLITAAAGVFTFTDLSIQKASEPDEQYQLVFSVQDRTDIPAVSTASFAVIIGPSAILEFRQAPTFQSSGLTFPVQPCIALLDAGRNLIQTDSHVSASLVGPPQSALSGAVAASAGGLAAFTDMIISQIEPGASYRLIFSSQGLDLASLPFEGASGPPAGIEVVIEPSNVSSSALFGSPPVVHVFDAGQTLVSDFTQVTASLFNREGLLVADGLVGGVAETINGSARFSELTVGPAGEGFALRFMAGIATKNSQPFVVAVGPAVKLAIGSEPTANVFGVDLYPVPVVVVLDSGNNWVSTSVLTVSLVLIVPPAQSPAPPTVLSGVIQRAIQDGVAEFTGVTINNAGKSFILEAHADGLHSAQTSEFDVTGPPARLAIAQQPGGRGRGMEASADQALLLQPIIHVLDNDGNLLEYDQFPATITASFSLPGALRGSLQAAVIRGEAHFQNLQIVKSSASTVITFHYQGSLLRASISAHPFQVLSGPPHHLQIVQQPGASTRGQLLGLQPALRILDDWENDVAWYNSSVGAQLFLGVNDTTEYLGGQQAVSFGTSSTGFAQFTDLQVQIEGEGFAIRFRSAGFRITSQTFNIKQGPPYALLSMSASTPAGVMDTNQGILEPQPVIHVVDKGGFKLDSMDGSNCAGESCLVSVQLICCPLNFLGEYIGSGTLRGTTAVVTSKGVAAFTDIQIDASGEYTLRFIVEVIEGVSARMTVDVGNILVQDVASLGLSTQPSHAVLGLPLRYQPTIHILDGTGQLVVGSLQTVDVATAAGVGCTQLSGTTSVAVKLGVAAFTDLVVGAFSGGTNCQLNFTASNPTLLLLSDSFSTSFGPTTLALSTQPAGVVAGSPFQVQPVLQFRELGGALLTSESGQSASVSVFRSDGGTWCREDSCASTLSGTSIAYSVAGETTFTDLRLDKPLPEGYMLMFTMGRNVAYSSVFNVTVGPAVHMTVLQEPFDVQIDTNMQPAPLVAIQDGGGNVVATNDSITATVLPSAAFGTIVTGGESSAVHGIAEFDSLQLSEAALMLSLVFSTAQLSVVSAGFSVHKSAAKIVLREFGVTEVVAGMPMSPEPQIAILDQLGFITSSDSKSVLSAGVVSETAGGAFSNTTSYRGIGQFNDLRLFAANQAIVIRFFLSGQPAIFIDSPTFSVRAGSASAMSILQQPQTASAGLEMYPFPSVQLVDDWSNDVLTSDEIVAVCVSNNSICRNDVELLGEIRAMPRHGSVSFARLILKASPGQQYYLNFMMLNASSPVPAVESTAFELMRGLPMLTLRQQPGSASQAQPMAQQPIIAITDPAMTMFDYGIDYLTVTASLDSYSVSGATLSDDSGTCPCIARFRQGVAEFEGLQLSDPGAAFVIRFAAPALKLPDVVSDPFVVSGTAVYFQVLGLPSVVAYHESFTVEVRVLDPNANLVSTPTIILGLEQFAASVSHLLLGVSVREAGSGVAIFNNLQVSTIGEGFFLSFTSQTLEGRSGVFDVVRRNATAIVLEPFPTQVLAGSASLMQQRILVIDEFGLPSAFNDTVSVQVENNSTALTQNAIQVQVLSGTGVFDRLVFQRAGAGFTVTAEVTLTGQGIVLSASSNEFAVVPGSLAQLTVTAQPSNGIIGQSLSRQPVVAAQDSVGNTLSGFDKAISASLATNLSSTVGVLGGTLSGLSASAGIVAFTDLQFWVEGVFSLSFFTSEACGLQVETDNFVITGPVVNVSLTRAPAGAEGGTAFVQQPQVVLRDQSGDVVLAADQPVIVQECDQSVEVGGSSELHPELGVATFVGLTIDRVGAYTLCFAFAALSTSSPISVTTGDARFVSILVEPVILQADTEWSAGSPTPQIQLTDAGSNVVSATTFLYVEMVDDRTRIDTVKLKEVGALEFSDGRVQVQSNAITALRINRPARQVQAKFSIVGTSSFAISQLFDVVGGSCAQMTVLIQPGDEILGQTFRRHPSVQTEDAQGNVAGWIDSTLLVQIGSAHFSDSVLSGCETSQTPIDGVVTFVGCSISCAAAVGTTGCLGNDFTLTFIMPNCDDSAVTVTSDVFHLTEAANTIAVSALATSSTSSITFDPQPSVSFFDIPCGPEDFCAVRVSDSTRVVSAALINPGNGATLLGTTTAAIVDGVAIFTDLALAEAMAGYNISFSTTNIAPVYVAMDVVSGSVVSLQVTSQPSLSQPASAFGCAVSLFDAGGNLVDSNAEQFEITVSLLEDVSRFYGSVLDTSQASLTQVSVLGVATWSGLTVYVAPAVYSFVFSGTTVDGLVVSTTSNRIALSVGSIFELRLVSQPQSRESGSKLNPVSVQLFDEGGNPVVDTATLVSAQLSHGAGTLSGDTVVTSSEGVAVFENLTVTYSTGDAHHQLQFSVASIFVTSNPFFVHLPPQNMVLRTWPSDKALVATHLEQQPQVEFRDEQNNRAFGLTSTAIRASLDGSKALASYSCEGTTVPAPTCTTNLRKSDLPLGIVNPVLSIKVEMTDFFAAGEYLTAVTVAGQAISFDSLVSTGQDGLCGTYVTVAENIPLPDLETIPVFISTSIGVDCCACAGLYLHAVVDVFYEVFKGNNTAQVVEGVATFTDLTITQSGTYTLSFFTGNGSIPSIASQNISVAAGAATSLVMQSGFQPGSSTNNASKFAGVALPVQPRVRLLDDGGGVPASTDLAVIAAVEPSGGGVSGQEVLFGTVRVYPDPVTAVATFTNLAVNLVGSFVLTFRSGSLSVTSEAFTIEVGPIAQIKFSAQPGNAVFGLLIGQQPRVLLLDTGGNRVKGTPWLHVALQQGRDTGSALTGCSEKYSVLDAGEVVFAGCSVTGTESGVHTLVVHTVLTGEIFSDITDSDTLTLESEPFFMSGSAASMKMINTGLGGTSLDPLTVQPIVGIVDGSGALVRSFNGTVATSVVGPGNLSGTILQVVADGLVAFTDLHLRRSGDYVLSFHHELLNLTVSQNVSVVAGPPSRMVLEHFPQQTIAGAMLRGPAGSPIPAARVVDEAHNAIEDGLKIQVTTNCSHPSPRPCLEGNLAPESRLGIVEFSNVVPLQAGVMEFSFSALGPNTPLATAVIEVVAGEVSRLVFVVEPAQSVLARTLFDPTPSVELRDAHGNRVNTVVTPFTFFLSTSLLPGVELLGVRDVQPQDGVVVLRGASVSSQGLDFRLGCRGSGLATESRTFHAYEAHCCLRLVDMPDTTLAGAPFSVDPHLHLLDHAGMITAAPGPVISAALEFGLATLLGQTEVMALNGQAYFSNLTIDRVGTYRLVFSSQGSNGVTTVVSNELVVFPGVPYRLEMFLQPGGHATGGLAFPTQPVVLVVDAGGNIANQSVEITASLVNSTGSAVLSGQATSISGSVFGAPLEEFRLGVKVFEDLSINLIGNYGLLFTSNGLLPTSSTTFHVQLGAVAKLSVFIEPADAVSGSSFGVQPHVQVQDAGGNLVEMLQYDVTVSILLHSIRYSLRSQVMLRGSTNALSNYGVAAFTDLSVDTAGEFCVLRFSSAGLADADSQQFPIAPASPLSGCPSSSKHFSDCGPSTNRALFLDVQTQPSATGSNETITPAPVVMLRDFDGLLLDKSGEVRVALIAPAVGLHGSPASMVNGVAVFTELRIDSIGTGLQLRFFFQGLWVDSGMFDVIAGAVSELQLDALPPEWVVNWALPSFSVHLLDAGGNTASDVSSCTSVTVFRERGPASAVLSGTITVASSSGEGVFSGVLISEAGHYTLRVSCSSDAAALSVISQEIAVLPYGVATDIVFSVPPSDAIASFDDSSAFKPYSLRPAPSVVMVDAVGNVVKGFNGIFTATQNATSSGILLGAGDKITSYPMLGAGTFDNAFFDISTGSFQRGVTSLIFRSSASALSNELSTEVRSNARIETGTVTLPSGSQTGEDFSVTVQFATSDKTLVSIYWGQVEAVLLDAASNSSFAWALPYSPTVSIAGGSAVLSGLVPPTAGAYRLQIRASRPEQYLSELVFSSAEFTVGAGAPTAMQVVVQPAGCVGGVACATQPVLEILDRLGNVVSASTSHVTASLVQDSMGRSLTGTLSTQGSDSNVTFTDLTIDLSGYVLMNFSGPGFVLSDPILVVVGDKAKAKVFVEPSGLQAGLPFTRQPIALASDLGGNWVAGITDTMEAGFICGIGCTQFGNTTARTRDGVAEFTDLGVNFAGDIQLRFRLTSVSVCSGSSCWEQTSLLTVQPGQLSQLVIRSNISEYVCSATVIAPAVEVEVQDAQGNLLSTGGTFMISVTLPMLTGGLSGTLVVETVAGIASFGDLAVDQACSRVAADPIALCYSLTFSSQGVSASSSAFSVLAGPSVGIQFNDSPEDTAVGHRAGISSLSLADAQGNPFVELPQGFANPCGTTTLLDPATVTVFLATEQLAGNAVILGQGEMAVAGASAALTGVAVNWNVASCPSAQDCRTQSVDDYRIVRLRATANFGSYAADSGTFTVDVAQPVNFAVQRTSHDSIHLVWNAPFHGPIPDKYLLKFQAVGGVWVEVQVATTEFTLSGVWFGDLFRFELCSQSIFSDGCAVKPPAPLFAAAVEPAQTVDVVFVNGDVVVLSWTGPALGTPPLSYRVTATQVPDGFETEVQTGVTGDNITLSGLAQNRTYVLKLYPRALAGEFYAPTGPSTAPVVLTPAAANVTVQCPGDICTGTELLLSWAAPPSPQYRPLSYRITVERTAGNGAAVQSQLDVAEAVTSVVLDNLLKGLQTTIRVTARNFVVPLYYGLSATVAVLPVSPPSPPTQLLLRMVGTTLVQIDWSPPADSGDGTPRGIGIDSYLVDYKARDAASFEPAVEVRARTFTVGGLQLGTNYTFRVRAQTSPVTGTVCAAQCADIAPLALIGAAADRTLVFGRVPVWDELQSPPLVDPPALYNLFVGNLFSLRVRALSVEAGQTVTISATGLADCGAELIPEAVGQASTATLALLPSAQDMDKTSWVCLVATDSYGAFSDQRCVRLFVVSPRPSFFSPLQALGNPDAVALEAVAGCELTVEVAAHDLTSGEGVSAQEAASRGYLVFIESDTSLAISLYGEADSPSLPPGAVLLEESTPLANPVRRTLRWTPARGQEGFAYLVCFRARDSLATYNSASAQADARFCTRISVARCRYCMQAGESLFSIAADWGTEWLNLWSGNDMLVRPAQAMEKTEVRLGPLYTASNQDSLLAVSTKFSVELHEILAWNPDLQAEFDRGNEPALFSGQELCVLPSTCTL